MSVQRWKPSWAQGRMIPAGVHPVDGYVSAADHARVVAEMERAHAAALADANLRWDAEVTRALDEGEKIGRADAEQAHAAALAGRNAETPIRGEHDPLCFPAIRDVRMGDWGPSCFTCQVIGMARAAAPRTLTADETCPTCGRSGHAESDTDA